MLTNPALIASSIAPSLVASETVWVLTAFLSSSSFFSYGIVKQVKLVAQTGVGIVDSFLELVKLAAENFFKACDSLLDKFYCVGVVNEAVFD